MHIPATIFVLDDYIYTENRHSGSDKLRDDDLCARGAARQSGCAGVRPVSPQAGQQISPMVVLQSLYPDLNWLG